jgi:hypothetical protein
MPGQTSAHAGRHYDVGSMSDRECPCLTLRSGTYRARASSSRTSGAPGRLSVIAGSSVCRWQCSLAAVRGRCCTSALYFVRQTPCLQIVVRTYGSGFDLRGGVLAVDRDVPLTTGVSGTLMARCLGPWTCVLPSDP